MHSASFQAKQKPNQETMPQISLITISIVILSTFAHVSATKNGTKPRPFKKIYAFGDSFTDTGNTRTFAGPFAFQFVSNPPYGSTFFHRPTNRYSDGRLVVDFLAEALSLRYLPPYRKHNADRSHGVNFAVAGATAIEHSYFVKNNITLNITPESIETQFKWFEKLLEKEGCKDSSATPTKCNAAFDEALIWFGEIGVNDYAYTVASFISGQTIRELALKRTIKFLEALLNKGAKYIVVQGLPPTGCLALPMEMSSYFDRDDMGCVGSLNSQSHIHNDVYQRMLTELHKKFPKAVIAYADYWMAYRTVIKNAAKYGFSDLYTACCRSGGGTYVNMFITCGSFMSYSCNYPSQYINWDGVHLTESMYKAIAHLFFNGTFSKPSFKYLLSRKEQSMYN